MYTYIIITGGTIDDNILLGVLSHTDDNKRIIAVDRGLEVCMRMGLIPNVIVGDYDSASESVVKYYREAKAAGQEIEFVDLEVHKDLTDTHVALLYAFDHHCGSIYIVGGTGSRLDHTMANIGLLKLSADRNIKTKIIDRNNIIYMLSSSANIPRIQGYKYISFIPYGGRVADVTLKGFEYNVTNQCFDMGESLGISNRIVSDDAFIEFTEGYVIVCYSVD